MKNASPVSHHSLAVILLAAVALLFPSHSKADTVLWNDTTGGATYVNLNSGFLLLKQTGILPGQGAGTLRVYFSVSSCSPGCSGNGCAAGFAANATIKVEILNAQNVVLESNQWCCTPAQQTPGQLLFTPVGVPFSVRISTSSHASPLCNADYVRLYSDQIVFSPPVVQETISKPTTPTGAATGTRNTYYLYTTGGSVSNLNHAVQYQIDWGDGTTSVWLAVGTAYKNHAWTAAGTYSVRAHARCSIDNNVLSTYSTALPVVIH